MLKKILFEIKNMGYISISNIAHKLNMSEELIEDGINQLIRMGYIKENENTNSCNTSCGNCPYANTCNKTFVKTMEITEKGEKLLNNL
ncbi:MAG: winged helix-turn-helix transcriptional regulator [Tissierellia bacterium]|nr:winged helix-turn-helix transcriptional regulator [Tissierellia bacterium]